MTIYNQVTIGGSIVNNIYSLNLNKSASDNNSSSSFSVELDNFNGNISGTYNVGDEVKIYSDTNPIPGSPTLQFIFNTSGTWINSTTNLVSGEMINAVLGSGKIGSSIDLSPGSLSYLRFAVTGSFFDGTSWAPGSSFLASSGTNRLFSISAWVNCAGSAQVPSGNTTSIIIGNRFGDNTSLTLDGAHTGSLSLTMRTDDSALTSTVFDASGLNKWHHVVATWKLNSRAGDLGSPFYPYAELFHNGSLLNTGSYLYAGNPYAINTLGSMYIGHDDRGKRGFNGRIDDLRVYHDRILTGSQVSEIYNSGTGNETINNGSKIIFIGVLEDRQYKGEPQDEVIVLGGRDYTARLMDRTVEPTTYTNLDAGSIVRHIVNTYVNDISTDVTVNNVNDTRIIIPRIVFNHLPVYDAIDKLCKLSNTIFYIDNDKDLHMEEASSTSTGFTFNSGNVLSANFREQRDTIYNQIWIYGDRYLDGYRETFTAGSPLGGSIFTLLYNPHNTSVTVSGAIIQPGAVANFSTIAPSGARYLVNYDDKKIIFVSGTINGANIPTSGNAVVITYDRSLPIVKVGDSDDSINTYKKRIKVITDKSIKDPQTAAAILVKELEDNKEPKKEGTLEIKGIYNLTPSQTAVVNLPYHNVTNKTYEILEANYNFNKTNNLTENVLNVKVNKKLSDVTDSVKDILLELRKAQAQEINESDVLTRFKFATGSLGIRQSGTIVSTVSNLGSSWILGKGPHGVTGPTFGGMLGSVTVSGINFLGDSRAAIVVQWSGNYP